LHMWEWDTRLRPAQFGDRIECARSP
jgi:hypothetical protein